MDTKTEEFLWMLLWTCETLSRPTWRNLTESFEGWAYRNGFLRQFNNAWRSSSGSNANLAIPATASTG